MQACGQETQHASEQRYQHEYQCAAHECPDHAVLAYGKCTLIECVVAPGSTKMSDSSGEPHSHEHTQRKICAKYLTTLAGYSAQPLCYYIQSTCCVHCPWYQYYQAQHQHAELEHLSDHTGLETATQCVGQRYGCQYEAHSMIIHAREHFYGLASCQHVDGKAADGQHAQLDHEQYLHTLTKSFLETAADGKTIWFLISETLGEPAEQYQAEEVANGKPEQTDQTILICLLCRYEHARSPHPRSTCAHGSLYGIEFSLCYQEPVFGMAVTAGEQICQSKHHSSIYCQDCKTCFRLEQRENLSQVHCFSFQETIVGSPSRQACRPCHS